jgi:isopenicillin-N epimerase
MTSENGTRTPETVATPGLSRRRFMQLVGVGATATTLGPVASALPGTTALAQARPSGPSGTAADDPYWNNVAGQFSMNRKIVNLNAGHYGVMPDVVKDAYQESIEVLNYDNTFYLGRTYPRQFQDVRGQLANLTGVAVEEIAITRGVTEALQNLIGGYNKIGPGEVAIYADIDYPSMQWAMESLRGRRRAEVVKIAIDATPGTLPSRQSIINAYTQAMDQNPTAKLLLLTDMVHRTGMVLPTAEITEIARERGVDVIVDAAHSWAHVDFTIPDLRCDFAGFNCHKWLNAPLGVGFLYVKTGRFADIDNDHGAPGSDAAAAVWTGTANSANVMAVPAAIDFHRRIGGANKERRLTYLRDYWVSAVRELDRIEVLTPSEPGMYGAITAFRVSELDNSKVPGWLLERHGIFTVQSGGGPRGDGIRVTPGLYNVPNDLDRFIEALHELNSIRTL